MSEQQVGSSSVNVAAQVSPETEGAGTTALVLEIVFGLFSLLGIGHAYSGRLMLGLGLMIGWWLFIIAATVGTGLTFGAGACLAVPIYIAVPIISGIQARMHVRKKALPGSWASVAGLAGGGCLFVIVSSVLLFVIAPSFLIGLGLLGDSFSR